MTRDEIIKLAMQAYGDWFPNVPIPNELERFVAIVAAAEREFMKSDGWRQCAKDQRTTQFCGQVQAAVAAEREACAKVCEEHWRFNGSASECADAIRARGEK